MLYVCHNFLKHKKRERDKGATLVVLLDITKQQCFDLHPAKGLQGLQELPENPVAVGALITNLSSSQAWKLPMSSGSKMDTTMAYNGAPDCAPFRNSILSIQAQTLSRQRV